MKLIQLIRQIQYQPISVKDQAYSQLEDTTYFV